MQEVIKKAIEGGYGSENGKYTYYTKDGTLGGWWKKWKSENEEGEETEIESPCCFYSWQYQVLLFVRPDFWQALGKACGWGTKRVLGSQGMLERNTWLHEAKTFHEINLTEGLDKAVAYLEEVIK